MNQLYDDDNTIAWGDESLRNGNDGTAYSVIALRFAQWTSRDDAALHKLLPKGALKLHWYELVPDVKAQAIECIAAMDFSATIVRIAHVDATKQERARRKCLVRLLPMLESQGVKTLALESRGKALDNRDVKLLDGLKGSLTVSALRITHMPGSDDSRLWVADQILGAHGDYRSSIAQDGDYWNMIADKVSVVPTSPC